ncbi:unnamed protein product [Rotaria magnacalcarata]
MELLVYRKSSAGKHSKRLYGDICNETLNTIYPIVPGTCSCPDLIQRKRINGTRLDTYAYDCNAPLVGFSGLCLWFVFFFQYPDKSRCPTPTTWTGPKCTYSTGQTWTGSTCVAIG